MMRPRPPPLTHPETFYRQALSRRRLFVLFVHFETVVPSADLLLCFLEAPLGGGIAVGSGGLQTVPDLFELSFELVELAAKKNGTLARSARTK